MLAPTSTAAVPNFVLKGSGTLVSYEDLAKLRVEFYTRDVSVLIAACSLAFLNAGEHARTTNDEVHTYSTPITFSQADHWSMSLVFKSCNSAH